MSISALEGCDLLRFGEQFADRLSAAATLLEKAPDLRREREWLAAGQALVQQALVPATGLLERAHLLPELPELRAERAGAAQSLWVEALEKLLAGITFHVSGRAPIIEALFPHQKLAPLSKTAKEVAQKFQEDFEKRLGSSYVSRMLSSEDFAFAVPVVEAIRSTYAAWEACFGDGGLPPEEAEALRQQLAHAGEKTDLAVRQARLLAEAALVPLAGAYEATALSQKPRRRTSRAPLAPAPAPALPAAPPPPEEQPAPVEASPKVSRKRRGAAEPVAKPAAEPEAAG